MSEQTSTPKLPIGAKVLVRRRVTGKSLELAEELAVKGGSEALIRAAGGDEAVAKLLHDGERELAGA